MVKLSLGACLNLKNLVRGEGVEASLKPFLRLADHIKVQDQQLQILHDSLLKYSSELTPPSWSGMKRDSPHRMRVFGFINSVFEALLGSQGTMSSKSIEWLVDG